MPALVRLFIWHYVSGFVVAGIFVAGFLVFDIASIRSIALHTDGGIIGLVAFYAVMGLTFASLQTGIAVWVLSGREPPSRPTRRSGHIYRRITKQDVVPVPAK